MLNPYGERTFIAEGDRITIQPGRVLENLLHRMERIDLDPTTSWAPEELMSEEEISTMFVQFRMGEMVVTETAWNARQVLKRWPAEFLEHHIVPEASLEIFIDDVAIDPADGDIGRKVINRALASTRHVETHPELADLDAEQLMAVWLAVVFWFGIKSSSLHQRCGAQE